MTVEDLVFGPLTRGDSRIHYQDVLYNDEVVAAIAMMNVGPLKPIKCWFQKCFPDTPENRELGDGWYEHWDEEDMIYVMFDTPEKLVGVLNEV